MHPEERAAISGALSRGLSGEDSDKRGFIFPIIVLIIEIIGMNSSFLFGQKLHFWHFSEEQCSTMT